MLTPNWLDWSSCSQIKRAARRHQNTINRRLMFEALEDRRVLATFTVTNLLDAPVTGFGQQVGTLRQAVFDANHTPGADVIEFAPGLAGTIELAIADDVSIGASALIVSSSIVIQGNSSGITIGRNASAGEMRLFYVPAAGSLVMNSVSLTDGKIRGVDGSAAGEDGGEARGGAIYNQGSVQILSSALYGNQATGGNAGSGGNGGSGRGGAIYNDGGTVAVTNSTFSDNAVYSGAGIIVPSSFGGAIFSRNGSTTVHNSTITNTTAATSGRGIYILADQGTASADIRSTIIGQAEMSALRPEFQAVPVAESDQLMITGDNNLIRSQGGFHSITVSTDDPQLGPLQNNGGPTPTHALGETSPAINMGDNLQGLATDQRGIGFTRVVSGIADIGAFELQSGSGPALLGDYNLSQTVDAADYVLWRKTLGTPVAQYAGADGNGNSTVDEGDFDVWRSQFGATGVAASASQSGFQAASTLVKDSRVISYSTLLGEQGPTNLRSAIVQKSFSRPIGNQVHRSMSVGIINTGFESYLASRRNLGSPREETAVDRGSRFSERSGEPCSAEAWNQGPDIVDAVFVGWPAVA